MKLLSRSAFLRLKDVTIEVAIEYDMFMDWFPTLGMFVQCKNDNEPLIEGLCTEEEWEKATQLLVFKDFELHLFGKHQVRVTNGTCTLAFQACDKQDDIVMDVTPYNVGGVYNMDELVKYELELTHPW